MDGSQIPLPRLLHLTVVGPNRRALSRSSPWLMSPVPCLHSDGLGMPSGSLLGASASSRGRWKITNAVQNLRSFSVRREETRGKVCPVPCHPFSSLPRTRLGLGREENGGNLCLISHNHDLLRRYAVASLSNNVVYASLHSCLKKNLPKQETLNGPKVRQARKINKRKLFSGQQGADLSRKFTHRFERRLEKQLEKSSTKHTETPYRLENFVYGGNNGFFPFILTHYLNLGSVRARATARQTRGL